MRSAKMARTPRRAADLLADDDAAQGRRQHHVAPQARVAAAMRGAEGLGAGGVLQHERALQVAGTVEARGQPEVPVEQGAGLAEMAQDVGVVHRTVV